MPKVSASAQVAAGPEQVWQTVIDLPRFAEWLTIHDSFLGDAPSSLTEGAAYKQRVKLMGMPAEIAWTVATVSEPSHLEIEGDGPMGIKAVNRFLIAPSGDGTSVTFEMEFNGPALNGPMASMAEKQSAKACQASVEKLSKLLG